MRLARLLISLAWISTASVCLAQDETRKTPPPAKQDQAALEAAFEKSMTDSVMVGRYSVDGRQDKNPAPEKYTIQSVKKLRGDLWLFTARIQYGKHDVTLPMPLTVKWAGDTPMITLTDVTIPGLGTFTSRVLIYRDRYAGTWQHGQAGGHLWGTVEPGGAKEAKGDG